MAAVQIGNRFGIRVCKEITDALWRERRGGRWEAPRRRRCRCASSRGPQQSVSVISLQTLRALSRKTSQSWRSALRQIWSRTIERNRRRSRAYIEDFAIEERPKMV